MMERMKVVEPIKGDSRDDAYLKEGEEKVTPTARASMLVAMASRIILRMIREQSTHSLPDSETRNHIKSDDAQEE